MIIKNGKILLGKRKGSHGENTYGWVGGHLEFGETPEQCLEREALEEAGISLKNITFLCVSNIIAYNKHYLDLEFTAETDDEPKVMETTKLESWDWYDLDNLPSPLFKAVELGIASYKSKQVYNT